MFQIEIKPVFITGKRAKVCRLPLSLNGYGATAHWSVRSRVKKQFQDQVFWLLKQAKVPKMKKAKVTIFNHTVRPLDIDNLYSSAKPLFDGVVLAGILDDDNEEIMEMCCKNVKVAHFTEERVYLTIEEIN